MPLPPDENVVASQPAQHVVARTAHEAVSAGGADHDLRPGAAHGGRLDQLVVAERALARAGPGDRLLAYPYRLSGRY